MTRYSVVIPVFKSATIVAETIERTVAFLEAEGLDYELILVNDAPPDETWSIVSRKAQENPRITAICLMRNYGQHTAVLCGLQHATGDYIVTMDDDLQNPPEEIRRLIDKAAEANYDLVVGEFRAKKHALHRRLGSRVIAWLNGWIFGKPKDFALSNFRLIRKDVVERICSHRTTYPYITGLAVLYSAKRANTLVEHRERREGKSTYGLLKIAALVLIIMFNYSGFPLHLVAVIGIVLSVTSFLVGAALLIRGLIVTSSVPGWTSLVTIMTFFNSFVFLMISMLGEYVVRLQQQLTSTHNYHVLEIVGRGK